MDGSADARLDGKPLDAEAGPRDAAADRAAEGDGGEDAATDAAASDGSAADGGPRPDGSAGPDATAPDGGPPVCAGGETYFYVMDSLAFAREESAAVAPGFDLDGRDSDFDDPLGCYQLDYESPDGRTGIDNQGALLAPSLEEVAETDLDAELEATVQSGEALLLLELEHVDDFADDPCVIASVMIGLLPSGVAMPTLDASGGFEPGQRFDVDARSVDSSGMAHARVGARIEGGVLRTGRADLPFLLPTGTGSSYEVTLRNGKLEASPTAMAVGGGVLAGGLEVESFVDWIADGRSVGMRDDVRLVGESLADLQPDATGDMCGRISVPFLFGGVEAERGVTR